MQCQTGHCASGLANLVLWPQMRLTCVVQSEANILCVEGQQYTRSDPSCSLNFWLAYWSVRIYYYDTQAVIEY